MPVISCTVSDKIKKMALPILKKLPEPFPFFRPALTAVIDITVVTGTACALAYLSSIPIATAITMQIVFAISWVVFDIIQDDPERDSEEEIIESMQQRINSANGLNLKLHAVVESLENQVNESSDSDGSTRVKSDTEEEPFYTEEQKKAYREQLNKLTELIPIAEATGENLNELHKISELTEAK